MPFRKKPPAKTSPPPGGKVPFAKKKGRLVRHVAHGALLAVGFTALQYFNEDLSEQRRLFDPRVVDSLQAPLTHYHE